LDLSRANQAGGMCRFGGHTYGMYPNPWRFVLREKWRGLQSRCENRELKILAAEAELILQDLCRG